MSQVSYIVARERRRRVNGGDRTCVVEGCGESRPFAIHEQLGIPKAARRLARSYCYDHVLFDHGGAFERHHISGIGRGPTWRMPRNDHRVLTQKMNHFLAPRFLSYGRSPEEEQFATAVGHVFLSDQMLGRGNSPYRSIPIPEGTTSITVNLADFPHFVHVLGTDTAWWQPDWHSSLVRLP